MGYIMETRLIERRFTNKLVYAYARTRSHLHAIVARLVIRWLLGIWPSFPAKLLPIERDPRRRDSLSLSLSRDSNRFRFNFSDDRISTRARKVG